MSSWYDLRASRPWGLCLSLILATGAALLSGAVWPSAASAGDAGLTGEILAVDAGGRSLRLRAPDGTERVVEVAPGAEVRREGLPAALWALRAVVPGFCHEARLILDDTGRAVRVEGFYPGVEARVAMVEEGALLLELAPGAAGGPLESRRAPLTPGFQVYRTGGWAGPQVLRPGQWAWVLFDLQGCVKKLALPE